MQNFKFHIGSRIWKTVLAVFVCAVAGWLLHIQPFYSMIAAILCMQSTTELSMKKGLERVIGTAIGGAAALIVLVIIDFTPLTAFSFLYYVIISVFMAPIIYTTVLINKQGSAFISCVVFLSVVLTHYEVLNHYLFAFQRMLETIFGIAVAVIINKLIRNPDKRKSKEPKQEVISGKEK